MSKIQQQQGVVLVISLVFLALMTIVGVTAMQGTTQEAKMANNAAQRGLAFQYAETGLRIAEASLNSVVTNPFNNTTPGLRGPVYIPTTNIASYWMEYKWKATDPADGGSVCWCDDPANFLLCDTLSNEIKQEQRYVIERLTEVNTKESNGSTENGNVLPEARRFLYRITARSTGNVTDAVVILQSTIM